MILLRIIYNVILVTICCLLVFDHLNVFVDASHLSVTLKHVPYNANFTRLCHEVHSLYLNTSTPTPPGNYCVDGLELRYYHMEVVEVSFENATLRTDHPRLDRYPYELNERLDAANFFSYWVGGEVLVVSMHTRHDTTVVITMASLLGITLVYLLFLYWYGTSRSAYIGVGIVD